MATVHFHGEPAHTIGDLPALGTTLPNISLVDATLADITNDTIAGTRVIFNVFPSIDTGVCATSVRRFNEEAAGLDNTTVVCVSHDLPFALGRFCGAEGINNVVVGSAFRSMIPLDRFGKEGELDTAILFLASKASGYVVGAPILVDGGYSAI